MDLILSEKGLTVDKAINGLKIQALESQVGMKTLNKAVSTAINLAMDFFNVAGGMNESQVTQTAALWIEKHPMETFEDLILCLKNAKMGKYGKIYNRIDGQIVFDWFNQYLIDEKYERFEQIKQNEKVAYSNDFAGVMDFLDNVIAAKNENKEPEPERITQQKHLNNLIELLPELSVEQLKQMRTEYEKKNNNSIETEFGKPFDDYLKAIDRTIQIKKSNTK